MHCLHRFTPQLSEPPPSSTPHKLPRTPIARADAQLGAGLGDFSNVTAVSATLGPGIQAWREKAVSRTGAYTRLRKMRCDDIAVACPCFKSALYAACSVSAPDAIAGCNITRHNVRNVQAGRLCRCTPLLLCPPSPVWVGES
jgi:hypothetical protein